MLFYIREIHLYLALARATVEMLRRFTGPTQIFCRDHKAPTSRLELGRQKEMSCR